MKQGKKSALKAGIWYTISNFLIKALTFITMPIFTRIMTKGDIGLFSNITSWFNIFAIVVTFELYSSVNLARFDYKEELDKYISSNLVLGNIVTLFFYIIILIFKDFFLDLFVMNEETLHIIFLYLFFYPAFQMFQIKSQIDYDYKKIVFVSVINALLSTIISILLVLSLKNALMGRVYGYFIPLIFSSIVIYFYLLKKGKTISSKYWKYSLAISFPLIWHLLAGYLLNSADKIMITKMISENANALYSVPYTIASIVSLLWLSLNNAWSPWAYDQMDKKQYGNLKKYSKPYTIFYVVVVFLVMLITPEVLYIMAGKSYTEAMYIFPPVMVGYVFQFIYSLYVNIEFYHKKQKNIAVGTVIATIINIALNYLFIPKYGYISAAYTTLIGYACLFIIHFIFVKRLKCTSWYDTLFFLIIISISLLFMFLCNYLYLYNIARYILIIIISIGMFSVIIINRKKIFSALKIDHWKNL
jgi:O-antigen/teichoic acid export membrane protein